MCQHSRNASRRRAQVWPRRTCAMIRAKEIGCVLRHCVCAVLLMTVQAAPLSERSRHCGTLAERQNTVYDVAVVGGGPNALRLLSCLRNQSVRVVTFEKDQVGNTIKDWYDGSVSHSARHTFQIGGLQPVECQQCLDSVWEGRSYSDRPKACTLDKGHMQHCGRDARSGDRGGGPCDDYEPNHQRHRAEAV